MPLARAIAFAGCLPFKHWLPRALGALPILTILLSTVAVAAQPKWIIMQNDNFRAYSSASESDTRDYLNQLE